MKLYPKTYEDLISIPKKTNLIGIESADGDLEGLVEKTRKFTIDSQKIFYECFIKKLWLELQFVHKGFQRNRFSLNGFSIETAFAYFMRAVVGSTNYLYNSKNANFCLRSYWDVFFPNILDDNPFEHPERFPFPFEHIGLDYMVWVAFVHDREEMLQYAEEHKMSLFDFVNWSANHVLCFNDEVGVEIYKPTHTLPHRDYYIKNTAFKGIKEFSYGFEIKRGNVFDIKKKVFEEIEKEKKNAERVEMIIQEKLKEK